MIRVIHTNNYVNKTKTWMKYFLKVIYEYEVIQELNYKFTFAKRGSYSIS